MCLLAENRMNVRFVLMSNMCVSIMSVVVTHTCKNHAVENYDC